MGHAATDRRKWCKMAYVASNRSVSDGRGLGSRLAEIGKDLALAWRAHRIYRQTLAELQALSPRDLADLGLSSDMLHQIAHQAAYGRQG
jgi:uncharacterized protein YjiS (DUF1127 family)